MSLAETDRPSATRIFGRPVCELTLEARGKSHPEQILMMRWRAMVVDRPFSEREGFKDEAPLIYEAAPDAIRYGLREVLHILGYRTPNRAAAHTMLCVKNLPGSSKLDRLPKRGMRK